MNKDEFLKAKAKYQFGYDFEGKDVLKNHEKKYETLDKYRDLRMAFMDDMFVDFAFSIADDMLVLLDERNNEPIIYNHGNYAIIVGVVLNFVHLIQLKILQVLLEFYINVLGILKQ